MGDTQGQAAQFLGVSQNTVGDHLARLYKKWRTHSQEEALKIALDNSWLDVELS